MPPKTKEKTANKSGLSEHHKKKNMIKVSMQDRATCWCQGFRIGCGKLLGRTQRFAHKAKENAKMEEASSPAPSNEVQETLRLIEERQEAARIAQNIQGSPDAPQLQLEEDGMEVQDFGDDGMLQDDAEMLYADAPAPEVAELFHLEVEGLAEQEDVPEELLEEEEEEEGGEPQFLWDQAESGEDSDDDVLRAAEDEQWEEIQRLLLECQDEGLSEHDLADIQGLAYNLKHSHSREALQDLATMMKLRSPYIMKKKLEHFSGLKEECYDCCIDSCMLFAGPFADLEACKICSEPRRDNRGKPRNVFRYLPIIPRLQSFFQSQKIIDMLRYRQELGPYEGTLRDVFDGEHFRELLGKTVSVDGVDYEHKIGDSEWDIFLGFTFDGVSLWRGLGSVKARASTTCWPVAVIVYSFNPILRTRQEHIFSLGVIPGPHSPKHVNSFLYPFFDECRKGAIGIPTFHRSLDRMFMMRFYTIFNTMDMPALAKANGSKNAGAIIPCHECPIEGIRDPAKKTVTTYYVPHQRPGDEESQTDDLLANLKTHTFYEAAWHELSEAETIAEYKQVQSTYGITCIPILGLLPSIDLVKSFPYGLMHLLFENNAPNMVLHWQGNYKKLDPQDDAYALDDATWVQIGLETAATIRTTPSTMTRATPDIWLYSSKFTAESWAFWITWLAPYLMEGRLPAVYYNHLLLFTDIIKAVTSLEITEEMLDKLNIDVKLWHAQYENLYYRFEMDRISACPLTLHALIHLHNDTCHAGPLSRIWEYVTERFMGKIARSVTSRQYPFSQLAETVKKMEQVKMVAFKYGLEKKLYFGKERRDWSNVTQQEKAYPEINDTTVLKSPVDVDYEWPKAHQTQAAIYFKQALQLDASAHKIAKILSKKVVRWGKFRVKGEKNVVRSAWAAERVSADRLRDSSFVRVELLVDRNMDDPTLPDVPELVVLYGQLLYIVHITLPKNKKLKIEQDCEALLGIVQFCKDARGDAALRPVWYTEMGVTQAVNISTIQCSVGRVKVAGTPSRWGILDVNYGCASTTFLEDEDNSGDGSDDE